MRERGRERGRSREEGGGERERGTGRQQGSEREGVRDWGYRRQAGRKGRTGRTSEREAAVQLERGEYASPVNGTNQLRLRESQWQC